MKEKIRKFFGILALEFDDMREGMGMLIKLSEERFRKHEITGYVWTENTALLKREQVVVRMIAEKVAKLNPEQFETLDEAADEVRRLIRGMPGIPQAVPDFIEKRIEKVMKYINDEVQI